MSRPTLHLTNWASHRTPGMFGPGRRLSIMLYAGKHVRPDGHVYLLIPCEGDEPAMLAELIRLRRLKLAVPPELLARYRGSLESRWTAYEGRRMFASGRFAASLTPNGDQEFPIRDGDTLLCACAVGAECHRCWAAPFLHRAGWRVVLDGNEVGAEPAPSLFGRPR